MHKKPLRLLLHQPVHFNLLTLTLPPLHLNHWISYPLTLNIQCCLYSTSSTFGFLGAFIGCFLFYCHWVYIFVSFFWWFVSEFKITWEDVVIKRVDFQVPLWTDKHFLRLKNPRITPCLQLAFIIPPYQQQAPHNIHKLPLSETTPLFDFHPYSIFQSEIIIHTEHP